MKNSKSHIFKGTIYAILAGVLWAFSGVFGQIFFEQYGGNALWITTFRLTVAGIILLTISLIQKPSEFFSIWKDKKNYAPLFGYAIFGVLMVQLTFYACIQVAGAATATVLQFTSPIFLLAYLAIFRRQKPNLKSLILVLIAMTGIFFLTTHGNISTMALSPLALLLGGLSAIAVVSYSLIPKRLLQTYDVMNVTGWGMIIAGFVMNCVHPVWHLDFTLTTESFLLALGVAVIGTAIAFMFNMSAIKYVSAIVAEVCAAMEPILAAVFSIFLFDMPFDAVVGISMLVTLVSVILLSLEEGKS
ncbi:DMT family transporter [Lactococcus raffinolactis]|jgi:drug/metabolite transporter (DMT)-like permease|uniref:EamA family transporter n=1 Tax=Pseudolactococcus raffinolactis TaxID=1366 RepID=A0AAE6YKJ1_9LACT|nr:DMT family transporter [Lactococcus raffinolactis]MBR2542534.1 EamA family transporter [Lactococcus sp.]MDT2766800.1 DMT family transporter [Lactococcus raffinolactis]MDT2789929.1 DMT family transporter [Lactococcus raffinolactis]PCS12753.1 transporter [Lactococcus raffinolactis]QIW56197.1 EamA family transporter [Lactococcus raffinolactis]